MEYNYNRENELIAIDIREEIDKGNQDNLNKTLRVIDVIRTRDSVYATKVTSRKDANPLITLYVENDDVLYRTNTSFDALWIDGLINVLKETKAYLKKHPRKFKVKH